MQRVSLSESSSLFGYSHIYRHPKNRLLGLLFFPHQHQQQQGEEGNDNNHLDDDDLDTLQQVEDWYRRNVEVVVKIPIPVRTSNKTILTLPISTT